MTSEHNFIIITGGPGVGKTTLLEALHARGIAYVPEVARTIIKEQMNSGGEALPWKNKEKYSQYMLDRSVETYLSAQKQFAKDILFFDRGIPDTLSYCRLAKIPVSRKLEWAVHQYRYNYKVLILPPWEEIYQTDNERKQDFKEAVTTFEVLLSTYQELEYELVEVPKMQIEERVNFVLNEFSFQKTESIGKIAGKR